MALQGDGNGIVTIPTATATGDFSIVFDSIKLTQPANAEVIIGDNSANNTFLAIFSPSNVGARLKGFNVSPQYSGSIDEVVKIELARVGTSATLYINDVGVGFVTMDVGLDFVVNTLFSYDSGSLKGSMLLSGVITMTGFGATRTYNTNGTGTTLVDTTSAQNGTLSGFTTGGFVAGGSIFGVTFPPNNYFKRGDLSKQITVPFSGTCTTSGAMEYSYDNSTWLTLDATPTTTWSGNVIITGQQDIYLRLSDDVGTVTTLNKITATDLNIAVAMSQSNGVTRVSNHQPINILGGNPHPMLYKSGAYSELEDPTSFAENYGSYWVYLAQWYSEQGIQIGFTNVSVGGTSISSWQQGGTLLDRCEDFAIATGGLDLVYTIIGETDSEGSMPKDTFKTLYNASASYLNTTYGCTFNAIKFPVGFYLGGITNPSVVAIREAYDELISENAYINFAGDLSVIDVDGGDGLHLKTDQQAIDAYNIILTAITSSTFTMVDTGVPDGSYSIKFWNLNTNLLIEESSVTFSGGAASQLILATIGSDVLAFTAGSNSPVTGIAYDGVTE